MPYRTQYQLPFRFRVRIRALAVLVISVAFCSKPDSLYGACGDWLEAGGHERLSHDLPDESHLADGYMGKGPSPVRQPCNGPECRQRRSETPIGPATPIFEPSPQQQACLFAFELRPRLHVQQCLRLTALQQGRIDPFIPERPPRS